MGTASQQISSIMPAIPSAQDQQLPENPQQEIASRVQDAAAVPIAQQVEQAEFTPASNLDALETVHEPRLRRFSIQKLGANIPSVA